MGLGFGQNFPRRLFSRFLVGQVVFVLVVLTAVGLSARFVFRQSFVRQASEQVRPVLDSLALGLVELDARALSDSSPGLAAESVGPEKRSGKTPENSSALAPWCAARSGGAFTFALARLEPVPGTLCSTVPFSVASGESRDLRVARRQGFGTAVVSDPESGLPVLVASLVVALKQGPRDGEGAQRLALRAAMPLPALAEALRFFDRSLVGVLFFLGVTFTAFSAWTGRRLVVPLGRLLQKARGVSERGEPEGASRAEVDAEWSDLESSLDRIQSHLQSKTETLAREREELATLMSAISEAIVAVDREGIPLFYNSHFAVSFLPRPIGLKSTAIPSLGEVFRAPEVLEAFDRAWVSGLNQSVEVRLHPLSSGAGAGEALSRYYRLSVAPLRRSGEIYGAVGIFHDITELKQVEQIRIDFVANVSHELRTPLTSIKGYTDTLRDDLREGKLESAEKFFEIIGRNVDRLMSLISDLLDLSSLESSSPNSLPNGVQKVSVSTEELTRRVLGQLEKLRAKKAHQVETRFVAPYVDAQPERVEQVLTNLLENAIKYLPEGGRIRVVWEPLPQAVLLRVADNGPGIPPEHQTRLFERFYRIDKGRSRELGGTGLGLAIVKHIMQVHGGSVYVASEPGKGAEFVCQFPNASS